MKRIFLFTMLVCSLFVNTFFEKTSFADSGTVPNNYANGVSASANTAGIHQLIDCSRSGMSTLSVIVTAGASATVVVQAIGANPDGTPNPNYAITAYTLLSAASGASAPLTVPTGAFSFYNIYSATTGVAINYIAGCR